MKQSAKSTILLILAAILIFSSLLLNVRGFSNTPKSGPFANQRIDARELGVKCDGQTNDVTNINMAVLSANALAQNRGLDALVQLPAGICIIGGSPVYLKSHVSLTGEGQGRTILESTSALTKNHLIEAFEANAAGVSDLTIDMGDFTEIGTGAIRFTTSNDIHVFRVSIIKMGRFGISINGSNGFKLSENIIASTRANDDQNQCILTASSSESQNGQITGNRCINTGMDISGHDIAISRNQVTGTRFGAGIATQFDVFTHTLVIAENIVSGGRGTDVNATVVEGIEHHGSNSVVANNIIYDNDGSGISIVGKNNIVSNNVIYDNGKLSGYPGISMVYVSEDHNADGSLLSGNKAFNTAGHTGPQKFGYSEDSSLFQGIRLTGNDFRFNAVGETNIKSPATIVDSQFKK